MKRIICILSFLSFIAAVFASSHFSAQPHQQLITSITPFFSRENPETAFLSTGDDGFLVKWTDDDQGEHYQVTDVGIKLAACSPNGNYVAIYETDGGSINKISVWDWKTLTRKYQKKFSDSITSLSFSKKGTYLIAGTATVDGVIFIRTSNWTVVDKIKQNTSIVNYVDTSESEKTCVMYSPAGTLSYYNLQTGQLKEKFSVIQGLTNTVMFHDNIFLAGVKDNNIYVIHAYKGNTLTAIPAVNPVIISTSNDSELYYLEYDGKNNYTMKMLEKTDGIQISNPRIVKTFRGPRADAAIVQGCKIHDNILLGGKNGALYRTDSEPTSTTYSLEEITENTYAKIYDIAAEESDFYFLTSNAIFKSSHDTGLIDKQASTNGQTKILTYKNNAILWSASTRNPVIYYDFSTQKTTELFKPGNNIQNLKLASLDDKDYLVEIESNSNVNIYDFETKTLKKIYSGTGIQDAVLANNGKLYIGKSAFTNPKSPLICVDIQTMETVPLFIDGNVSFGLSINGNMLYGINLQTANNVTSTFVFSYNISTKQVTNILKFAEEDSEAFTYLNGDNLYTNIGKNKIYCYNLKSKKRFSYNRSASIPLKIIQNGNRVLILNWDGSISWAGVSSALLADWYLTKDDQWYEF